MPYGPQHDPDDGVERVLLLLQFGGVSRQGFLEYESLVKVQTEMVEQGTFEGGKFFKIGEKEAGG